ncbi:phage portal protein [Carboxylicivirga sediminis]|uniref:Phage portal protein n=1 Tax=Carboxylicivirga sediminis TaxID=2006564 RepID=A0A941IXA7_9BACT|nr:phage portal protein [Carboxylicivirga sediminis]MBR8535408.1 phage portal protein [Carboxylicivirga sediminis]
MPSFKDLLAKHGKDYDKIISELTKDTIDDRKTEEYIDEYKGKRERRSKSVGKRENKIIGEGTDKKIVEVAKLVFNFPKKIVRTAVAFCVGGDMVVSSGGDADDAFNLFKTTWEKKLKMKNNIKKFVRTVMIETKAALLFYPITEGEEDDKVMGLRVSLLDSESGEFYPHFDKYKDMDAFTRRYKTKNEDDKDVTVVEVYTAEQITTFTKESGDYQMTAKKNLFGKIPVVYAEQSQPEWEDIVTLMDAFEMRLSRLADSNDYFAEPLLKLFGEVESLPGKDKVGKMVKFKMEKNLSGDGKVSHGDAEYLTWDQMPDSTKLELEQLWNGIFSMTSTPDLSFDNVKGIGANLSGIALKMMFLDALLKAQENQETFGEAIQRMVSVVIAGIGYWESKYKKDLEEADIEVKHNDPIPDDLKEWLESLGQAKADGVMSLETIIDNNPLAKDKKKELESIRKEQQSNASREGDTIIGSQE